MALHLWYGAHLALSASFYYFFSNEYLKSLEFISIPVELCPEFLIHDLVLWSNMLVRNKINNLYSVEPFILKWDSVTKEMLSEHKERNLLYVFHTKDKILNQKDT